MSTITLNVEFGGGLELLFGNKRKHAVSLSTTAPTLTYLIQHLRTTLLTERPELFVEGDTVYVPLPIATIQINEDQSTRYSSTDQRYGLGAGRRGCIRAQAGR